MSSAGESGTFMAASKLSQMAMVEMGGEKEWLSGVGCKTRTGERAHRGDLYRMVALAREEWHLCGPSELLMGTSMQNVHNQRI